jgi:hypothetical protein
LHWIDEQAARNIYDLTSHDVLHERASCYVSQPMGATMGMGYLPTKEQVRIAKSTIFLAVVLDIDCLGHAKVINHRLDDWNFAVFVTKCSMYPGAPDSVTNPVFSECTERCRS